MYVSVANLAGDLGDRHDRLAKLAEEANRRPGKEERLTIDANTAAPAQSELGILVAVVTGNFLHEHHDPAPQGGIINSHERCDQP